MPKAGPPRRHGLYRGPPPTAGGLRAHRPPRRAAAGPPPEPAAGGVVSTGLRAGGNIGPSVTGRVPNSGAFVFPRMTAPSSFSRPLAKLSPWAIDFSKTSEPRLLR